MRSTSAPPLIWMLSKIWRSRTERGVNSSCHASARPVSVRSKFSRRPAVSPASTDRNSRFSRPAPECCGRACHLPASSRRKMPLALMRKSCAIGVRSSHSRPLPAASVKSPRLVSGCGSERRNFCCTKWPRTTGVALNCRCRSTRSKARAAKGSSASASRAHRRGAKTRQRFMRASPSIAACASRHRPAQRVRPTAFHGSGCRPPPVRTWRASGAGRWRRPGSDS